ncbi:MAG: hypothetical protein ABI947_27760 [Chloroflexota bacterium]
MRKIFALTLFLLAACQPASPTDPNAVARKWLDDADKKAIKITKVVTGNPKNYKADALWCVETDATLPEGSTYLLMVYRTGSNWTTREMTDGEYEWDLNGCPRS